MIFKFACAALCAIPVLAAPKYYDAKEYEVKKDEPREYDHYHLFKKEEHRGYDYGKDELHNVDLYVYNDDEDNEGHDYDHDEDDEDDKDDKDDKGDEDDKNDEDDEDDKDDEDDEDDRSHIKKYYHLDMHKPSDGLVCDSFKYFTYQADYIYNLIGDCDKTTDAYTWEQVKKAIYELEFALDAFDPTIDTADPLGKCFECKQESKIASCYTLYAEALIRTLKKIKEKTEYLTGEIDKHLLTAVYSLRAADYTFAYELGRRLTCDDHVSKIMETQGASDGSTTHSIREAFGQFIFTPLIVGDDEVGSPSPK